MLNKVYCNQCKEIHGIDKGPIECRYCGAIIGCFYHSQGKAFRHTKECQKKYEKERENVKT